MVPEGHAETLQLSAIKKDVLDLKLEHWDSDTNGIKNWTKADEWGFNLPLISEKSLTENEKSLEEIKSLQEKNEKLAKALVKVTEQERPRFSPGQHLIDELHRCQNGECSCCAWLANEIGNYIEEFNQIG